MEQKFGDRLKAIRLEKHMSQDEFASLLGTSKQVISRYETNQRTPKITVANEYATVLNIPLNALLGDSSESKTEDSNITFDDFTYALHDETKELTEENKQKLLEMARFFKEQQDKSKSK